MRAAAADDCRGCFADYTLRVDNRRCWWWRGVYRQRKCGLCAGIACRISGNRPQRVRSFGERLRWRNTPKTVGINVKSANGDRAIVKRDGRAYWPGSVKFWLGIISRRIIAQIGGDAADIVIRIAKGWGSRRGGINRCLLYTSPSPRDRQKSRMPSSA